MRRNAQGSVEYLFMVAIAIVMIFVFVRKFFDPRFGTIHKTGELQNTIESEISEDIESAMNGQNG
ncbi:class III signal peptide-containing protein [Thermococcus camini]|uniref:class III signal peptide-containing protein n=1 Tax=Thermococcus camini TaxID=2016373 RepID=UPI0016608BA8|nr:class III signal peptide-containing protein [Thermococcus camini]